MKKRILIFITAIILLSTLAAEADSTFAINNKVITTPKIIKGRSLIPVRILKSFFGEYLEWEDQEKKLTVSTRDYNLELQAGNQVAAVDDKPYPLDIAPCLIEDQLFIPVRLLTRLYGGDLAWNGGEKKINYHSYQLQELNSNREEEQEEKKANFSSLHKFQPLIVLDPGHGGFDPGAIGVRGLEEKRVNLEMGIQLKRILEEDGYQVLLTRVNDSFISLSERAQLANFREADLFISLHANYNYNSRIEGTATYAHWSASEDNWALAWYVQHEMIKRTALRDNGLKAANFSVLRKTKMPALLVETAFLSNAKEERLLNSVAFQSKVAAGIRAGINKYFRQHKMKK